LDLHERLRALDALAQLLDNPRLLGDRAIARVHFSRRRPSLLRLERRELRPLRLLAPLVEKRRVQPLTPQERADLAALPRARLGLAQDPRLVLAGE